MEDCKFFFFEEEEEIVLVPISSKNPILGIAVFHFEDTAYLFIRIDFVKIVFGGFIEKC